MPPIDTRLTSPIGRVEAVSLNLRASRVGGGSADTPAKAEAADPTVVLGDTLEPGETPINAERVAQIRKALDQGTYPILPTTVADAIIAAGLILRTAK
jgi:negative regulator of flagellin synthesis FlgM